VWQGGTLPIPWESSDCALNSHERLVDPDRLPEEVLRLSNPLDWEEDTVMVFCADINAGQRKAIPQSQIFQFTRVNDGSYYNEFMEIMSTKAILRYTGTSRLYVARLLRNDSDDLYALREIVHQLPEPLGSPYQPLSADDFQDVQAHAGENSELTDLIQYLFEYEEALPVHVRVNYSRGFFTTLTKIRLSRGTGRPSGKLPSTSPKPDQRPRPVFRLWVDGGCPRGTSKSERPAPRTIVCVRSPNGYAQVYWTMRPRRHYSVALMG
jgi:hypothetical protein